MEDIEMKHSRDEWQALNLIVPTFILGIQFWTNSIPFYAKQVYLFITPILLGYLAFAIYYENLYLVHLQPVFSAVYQEGQGGHFLAFHKKGDKFDPYGEEYEEIFIPMYPVFLIILTIPSYFILKRWTLWKLNHV
jgi:hypothetical protein